VGVSENSLIDIAIGMSFTFFVLALFASAINEAITAALGTRAKSLEGWLTENLTQPATGQAAAAAEATANAKQKVAAFYSHPAIKGLTRAGKKPSYVSSEHAITALLDVGAGAKADVNRGYQITAQTAGEIPALIAGLPSGPIKEALESAWLRAGGNVATFRADAERWFDDAMDRLSGWYKRRVQVFLWIFGFAIACALNADAIHLATTLYKDPTVRQLIDAQASALKGPPDASKASDYLASLPLPLGWGGPNGQFPALWSWQFPLKILGILLTSAAVALGAPFWFDALSKLGSLRSSGPPPKTAKTS
jgi:hypothetical protein